MYPRKIDCSPAYGVGSVYFGVRGLAVPYCLEGLDSRYLLSAATMYEPDKFSEQLICFLAQFNISIEVLQAMAIDEIESMPGMNVHLLLEIQKLIRS